MNQVGSTSTERLPPEQGVAFSFSGLGYHTGKSNVLKFRRAEPGVAVVRIGDREPFSPRLQRDAADTSLRCTRVMGVGPMEHFLAALCILGVDGWILEATHGDFPLFDGSALAWRSAILATGSIAGPLLVAGPGRIVECSDSRGKFRFEPGPSLDIHVQWSHGPSGEEHWHGGVANLQDLLGARTFVTAREFLQAKALGALAGVDTDSGRLFAGGQIGPEEEALAQSLGVSSGEMAWTGGRERLPGECAAHKALDLLGDLFLCLGGIPRGKIEVTDAGHSLHVQAGQRLAE